MGCAKDRIMIDGEAYVRESAAAIVEPVNGMPYQIVRTFSAGVFAGYVASRNGQEVVMRNARRLWMWAGAASLSQLAMEGTSKPRECKFPCEVATVTLLQVIEILDVTECAQRSIAGVPIWKA